MCITLPTKGFCVVQGTSEFMNEERTGAEREESGCYKPDDLPEFYRGFRGKLKSWKEELIDCLKMSMCVKGTGVVTTFYMWEGFLRDICPLEK